ncbi:MAG: arginine deiminase family protein [Acidobacteriota bacterium]
MKFKTAVVRIPGEDFGGGETTAKLGPPDYKLILSQHREYINTLKKTGLDVVVLDPLPGYPDAYFVEDTAVIFPEMAVITNPGAQSRKGEEDGIELIMARFRDTDRIKPPGTLDGGDIIQADKHFFIGLSDRTNMEGADQLISFLDRFGYTAETIEVGDGLHLKSGANYLGEGKMLLTSSFRDFPGFSGYEKIVVEDEEEYAANTLVINGTIITPGGFPHTYDLLSGLGMPVITLDVSEVRKMDGGLTCMSLRF